MFYSLASKFLFSLPAEKAHDLTLQVAHLSPMLGKITGIESDPRLKVKIGNSHWNNPIGLAAGLDKNAEALDFFAGQGFGAIEAGTITLMPQDGNPKPRMFRYPEEKSLRNSLGFPNQGLKKISPRLSAFDGPVPLGANIGKNKDTSPEESIKELKTLFQGLRDKADYLVINVSSPNTPGLRALQEKGYLTELFTELNRVRLGTDLFLKVSPDLEAVKLKEVAQLAAEQKLTGIIATNTTIMSERGPGGMSGRLLKNKSAEIRSQLLNENLPLEIIGVGGFDEMSDFVEFWKLGGKVAQVYTSYIYQGPDLLSHLQKEMLEFLKISQIKSIEDFFLLPLSEKKKLLRVFQPA
jgi:dihydroorotate dehydrogenase